MTDFEVGDKVRLKDYLDPVPAGATGVITRVDASGAWPIIVDFSPHHPNGLVDPDEIELMNENDILDKELEALLNGPIEDDADPETLVEGESYFYNVFNTFFGGALDEDPDDWDVRGADFEGHDMVANPPHYQQYPFGEVIDITKHLGFLDGNVVKYVLRAPYKGSEIEDLKKAQQYLAWLIEKREEEA